MSEITLDDLRVLDLDDEFNDEMVPRRLTPAEFDRIATERGYVKFHLKVFEEVAEALGWVKRPVCGDCEGTGFAVEWIGSVPNHSSDIPCPSCGGTGFGRLVALDGIDWRALLERSRTTQEHKPLGGWCCEYHDGFEDGLATLVDHLDALDGGQE